MIRLLTLFCLLPHAVQAAPPRVITDIAPIHSLTAQIMGDAGTPDLLLPPSADPHDFSLRPSDAQRLSAADLVIWVGPGLTPWLTEPLATLAPNARQLELLDLPGWQPLPTREAGDHDEHDDHDNDGDHDPHDHGDTDPHGWLDPQIAQVWIMAIHDALVEQDPDNAAIYTENAAAATQSLQALDAEMRTQLTNLKTGYILPHDGYQYFENRFGLTPAGSIAGADARDPGPQQIAALRDQVRNDGITCVLSDNEITTRWTALITEGSDAKTQHLDATGAALKPGPDLYPALIRAMGAAFAECLS